MKLAVLLVVAAVSTAARADACPKTKRLVFDPPGDRHSLPQLTWDGARYQVVGYDGPPTNLIATTFDFGKSAPAHVSVGAGGVAQTATSGKELAIAYLGTAATAPRELIKESNLEWVMVDGRRAHSPSAGRNQSFFTVVDAAGKPLVKPIPLGDQRVMHTAPGVAVAWNPKASEWGVVWSEFNHLKFGRITKAGKLVQTTPVAIDGFIHASSRMLWTGTSFAFLASTPKGLMLYEAGAAGVRGTQVKLPQTTIIEPVLALSGSTFAIAYRTTRTGAPVKVTSLIASDKDPKNQRSAPMRPPENDIVTPEIHELLFVTMTGDKVSAPALVASATRGQILNTPVIQADGAQYVIAYAVRQTSKVGFDNRMVVARVDPAGKLAAGYPKRIDDENVHQGYASIAGTGCDLAVSYILGDPNNAVRVGVVRAP
ncbi:MAG: hypothetical protein H0T46_36925 [Deltaproteobacteria bacterium]|nr:hypothetical protein [Deltaproteobacteria bacterium]